LPGVKLDCFVFFCVGLKNKSSKTRRRAKDILSRVYSNTKCPSDSPVTPQKNVSGTTR